MKFPSLIPEWEVATSRYKELRKQMETDPYEVHPLDKAQYIRAIDERLQHYFGMFLLTSAAIAVAILWDLIARSI